ncbi:cytochrome P450 2D18 [Arthroderma uncinatum]|uniref:cytochrome P450 2D18 n=1 Tax=Arthroderma uncinatum TaxID=74035 RepID=UPI00144A8CD1|nr:cytochrome P450 2D18 [Arthroderma uncinatum]KAF3480833.1 cytochrome P450 2D18 [Arthroderma uncinatum]
MNSFWICGFVLILLTLWALFRGHFPGLRNPRLPPGPPCLPIIGNLHQVPKTGAHLKFTEWAAEYGPIFSLKVGPSTVVVLSSPYMIKQLVDKQSATYSDRPKFYIADHLVMQGDHLMFMSPDPRWRRGRKLYHQYFNESMCEKKHVCVQNAEAVQLLRDLYIQPDDFMGHCKRFTNSTIMSLVTGIRTPTASAPHMRHLYTVLDGLSEIFEPGASPPIDIFPFLAWLPESLFSNWKSRARGVAQTMDLVYGPLVDRVIRRREKFESGRHDSYLDMILDQQAKLQFTRHEIDIMVGNLLEGGSDTTSTMTIAFIQAMALYPAAQHEAQREIDVIVGEGRSPDWGDYASLPYVAMVIKETMRWRPVLPTAFPHATSKESTIDGMAVPAGSTVILNVWGLHHDGVKHVDPDQFNPLRYQCRTDLAPTYASSPDYENRDHYGYGSGRRICPGIHLAERGLFLAVAKILWAFDITPKHDAHGHPIPINADPATGYTDGFLRCAKPFPVQISIRSERRWETINAEFAQAEKVFSRYDV